MSDQAHSVSPPRRLGVLGGMGPLATADFMVKLVSATPAATDQEHIPVVVYSVPQTPDRAKAILTDGAVSPVPAMLDGLRTLEAAGAEAIAIPCITAHYWFDELCAASAVPLLHITDAIDVELRARNASGERVALLGTEGTLKGGHVELQLSKAGYDVVLPTDAQLRRYVLPSIAAVKGGDLTVALEHASQVVTQLEADGLAHVVLACTELPTALAGATATLKASCVDTVGALARYCVEWAFER